MSDSVYQVGGLELVEARSLRNDPLTMLGEFFEFTPTGLKQIAPAPIDYFELAGMHLQSKQDELRFQVGDWAVLLAETHGFQAYERLLATCGLDGRPEMVQDWAYVCRSVPFEVRTSDLSFSHHRVVAPVEDPAEQRELLRFAAAKGLSVSKFREHVKRYLGDEAPPDPPLRSDRLFETEQELYQKEVELQETQQELEQVKSELARFTGSLPAPEVAQGTIRTAIDLLRQLAEGLDKTKVLQDPDRELNRVRATLMALATDLEELGL